MDKTILICPCCGEDATFKFHSHDGLVTCDSNECEFNLAEKLAEMEASVKKWKAIHELHQGIVKISNGE